MGYLNQFPNTHFYDQDLGWLIKEYKRLEDNYEVLIDIYTVVQSQIKNITLEQLKTWLDDGTIETMLRNIITNKKYIFIGDSYMSGYTPDGYVASYIDMVITRLGLIKNTNAFPKAINGSGFVAHNEGYTFLDILKTFETEITDKQGITDIYVLGGYNDYISNNRDILSAIEMFKTYVTGMYPNAAITIGYLATDMQSSYIYNVNLNTIVYNAYKSCSLYGTRFINLGEVLHNRDLLSTDMYHPNLSGQTEIANQLYNFICGGDISTSNIYVGPTSKSYSNGSDYTVSFTLEESLTQTCTKLSLNSISITSGPYTFQPNVYYKLLPILNTKFMKSAVISVSGKPCTIVFSLSDGSLYAIPGVFGIDNGYLVFKHLHTSTAHALSQVVNAIQIDLAPTSFEFSLDNI